MPTLQSQNGRGRRGRSFPGWPIPFRSLNRGLSAALLTLPVPKGMIAGVCARLVWELREGSRPHIGEGLSRPAGC